jgi:uncharacterized protein YjbK
MADEVELKLMLEDRDAFLKVREALDALAEAVVHEQVNYYLDTTRLSLRAQKAMVRVRVADGQAVATCKTRATIEGGVQRAVEHEQPLPELEERLWLQAGQPRTTPQALGIMAWLCAGPGCALLQPLAADSALHTLGALANTRRDYTVRREQLRPGTGVQPVTLELDHSRYSAGAERFEIELEHADAAELAEDVQVWLDALAVIAEPATESKYAQFLRLSSER